MSCYSAQCYIIALEWTELQHAIKGGHNPSNTGVALTMCIALCARLSLAVGPAPLSPYGGGSAGPSPFQRLKLQRRKDTPTCNRATPARYISTTMPPTRAILLYRHRYRRHNCNCSTLQRTSANTCNIYKLDITTNH